MASSLSSLLPLLLLSLTSFAALSLADYPLPYNFTHVCDAKRYASLNLSIPDFAFCDKSLSYYVRAKNLVDSMNLTEKAKQLGNNNNGEWYAVAAGVPRLGLPAYNWWSEALHGVSYIGGGTSFGGPDVKAATSFPLPINSAAAFNATLWREIGKTISTEARAMNNLGFAGLTFWSPNINLVRDPRWGRALETPGECPTTAGIYAINFVRGLQDVEGQEHSNDPNSRPLKVSACCKHYAAYDVDYWRTTGSMTVDRFHYDANVTERDMVESYLKPFEMCVKEGDVSSVMCSYNKINGVPACADGRRMRGTIRDEWDLHGYVVSDCDSIKTIFEKQQWLDDTAIEATAQVMRAGLDLDCGWYYAQYLEETVKKGLIKESDVDEALINNYIVLLRLGWFDGNPLYDNLNASNVCSVDNMKLAASAARQGMVLLKNKGDALPLSPQKFKRIAVVGPHANATEVMIGNYNGVPCRYISPIDGLKKYAEVDYSQGCDGVQCHTDKYVFHAMKSAEAADATVIAVGLNLTYEREDWDRTGFDLPGYQNHLIETVANVSKGPVVVVIFSSGTVNISSFVKSGDVDAIIWAGYPGQEGGQAVADIIFGAYNPGGRLPVTWYPSEYTSQIPETSQQFRPNDELGYPGRTYRFYNGTTQFDFGYGLSYTKFSYSFVNPNVLVTKNVNNARQCYNFLPFEDKQLTDVPACQSALVSDLDCTAGDVSVQVSVANVGKLDGSDAVMLYAKQPQGLIGAPIKDLVAFERVFLKAGESKVVSFEIDACKRLAFVTESAQEVLPQGEHTLLVGDQKLPVYVHLQKEV
ncbi:probable beta-D-xylosidase 5 [Asparagus officinalis]|uniref:probable beta-D-xylosidase 5 n=1 Tax=Asparagus officinalis TaxID=4686 RepID=UPI00098DFEA7|nr:probable beta-D-xylosidase 5 [Asparagus officinalis]